MNTLADLPTPALLLDETRLQRNIARMQARADALGVALRPHVKTSKCLEVVQRQLAAGARSITVSTLKEAQTFFAAGITDIFYAVALPPNKVAAVLALAQQGCDLRVVVDSVPAAQAVAAACAGAARALKVLIEIDCDGHRSGLKPDDPAIADIGRVLHAAGVLQGVMTHAGASYDEHTPEGLARVAARERDATVQAAQALRGAGLPCPTVSVGSTPTALSAEHLHGVNELRAGVYVFHDLVMAGVGVCSTDDIALSVLASVIGHQPDRGWIVTDAGWMALSRDRGTQHQRIDQGYGLVCDMHGRPLPALWMSGANQEHGVISRRDGAADADLVQQHPVGSLLRVWPNHACATAAQHAGYHLLRTGPQGDTPAAFWPRFNGW
jgi:threo-3-hydroxy-D-aspartate ammonia-lyase